MANITRIGATVDGNSVGKWLVRWTVGTSKRWNIAESLHAAKRFLVNQGIVRDERDIAVMTDPVDFTIGW